MKNRFLSMNVEKRTVTGVVLEPGTVDAQQQRFVSEDDVEEGCYSFMEFPQGPVLMLCHEDKPSGLVLLENYCAPCEMELVDHQGEQVVILKGTWIQTWRITNDEVWEMVKNGDLIGFSPRGSAELDSEEDMELPED